MNSISMRRGTASKKIEYGRQDIGSSVPEAIYNAVAADQQLSSPNDIDDIEKWSLDKGYGRRNQRFLVCRSGDTA